MICYCKKDIPDGARRIGFTLDVDWGNNDLRGDMVGKRYEFCSFNCVAEWAADRAVTHDGVVVKEGTPV